VPQGLKEQLTTLEPQGLKVFKVILDRLGHKVLKVILVHKGRKGILGIREQGVHRVIQEQLALKEHKETPEQLVLKGLEVILGQQVH